MSASYASGKPWLYDGSTIPMSLWTAIAFVFLSLALASDALASSPAPSIGHKASGERASIASADLARDVPLAIAGLLAIVIGILGAVYLRHEQAQDRNDAHQLLAAIGDLKQAQVANWRKERLNDAQFFSRAELLSWLALLKSGDRYSQVVLFDTNFVQRLAETSLGALLVLDIHQDPIPPDDMSLFVSQG